MLKIALFLLFCCTALQAKTYHISDPTSEIGKALFERLIKDGHELVSKKQPIDGLILITPKPDWKFSLFPSEDQWITLFQNCFTTPLELLKNSLVYFPDQGSIIIISQLPQDPISNVLRSMWAAETTSLQQSLAPLGLHVTLLSEEKASALICQAVASLEIDSWLPAI